ncbi:hypothetical protein [Sphingomonas sp. Y38-1Y]|uniref:hypothetical protein n=1 Tax=Sphingomonas sp. Y38-1Y TaxID=3078265 RepID=UPI0028E295A2|nr:hypothetical protein [Sphingomonas sp. Y38-1Y]
MASIAVPAVAQTQAPTITVIGPSLKDSEARLRACIARGCPPAEEIDAVLGHAEGQFVAGDYRGARETVRRGVSRNRKFAKTAPEPVADLLRADARIAGHLGFADKARQSMMASEGVLRGAFGETDARSIAGRIATADAWLSQRRFDAAMEGYRAAERLAGRAGNARLEGLALLRRASLDAQLSSARSGDGRPDSLRRLLERREPELAVFVNAARIVDARIQVAQGKTDAMEAIIAAARQDVGNEPLLLHMPVIVLDETGDRVVDKLAKRGAPPLTSAQTPLLKVATEGNWADFGFWVGPDGRVREAEMLRSGPKLSGEWPKLVVASLGGRRYAPTTAPADEPGFYRVERFTMTAPFTQETRSRIRVRSAERKLVRLDLTAPSQATASAN